MSSPALLSVDKLNLSRGGRELIRELSFELRSGQLLQLVGENGAGKTSLLRVLAGLSRYGFEGSVCSEGLPIFSGQSQYFKRMLYLGHLSGVKGLLTPRENLCWHLSGNCNTDIDAIDYALDCVGLYGYEDVPGHKLSAGQQRRVNLARLYLVDCPIWLLDEPFTAIDRAGVETLEQLLLRHSQEGGAVLFTSHQPLVTVTCSGLVDLKGSQL